MLLKSLQKRSSLRIDHRNSPGSCTAAASFSARGRSAFASSSGYSRRIIMAQVGLMASTLAPASTCGMRRSRLWRAFWRTVSRSPCSQAGMPQHLRPLTQAVRTWFFSSTATVSRPISGSLFCT